MLAGFTPAAIIAQATLFWAEIDTVVYVVAGLGLMFTIANWAVAKFGRR